jgi:hypothetical protein
VSPKEQLMEKLHAQTRYDLAHKEQKAEEVQAQLLAARRERILPSEDDLQKSTRRSMNSKPSRNVGSEERRRWRG